MNLHCSCMELKRTKRGPKVQRGLSITRELYGRIQEEADKFGMSWNECAELVLERAFLAPSNSQSRAVGTRSSNEEVVRVAE